MKLFVLLIAMLSFNFSAVFAFGPMDQQSSEEVVYIEDVEDLLAGRNLHASCDGWFACQEGFCITGKNKDTVGVCVTTPVPNGYLCGCKAVKNFSAMEELDEQM